jgi:hypothetical protein
MALHIGREIENKYKESGLKLSEFAKRIHKSPRSIYDLFERSEIKTEQLQKISEVLNFDFFALYRQSDAREPESSYQTETGLQSQKKVSVVVELDGQEATLKAWIKRLTAINEAMN